jgi:hypothetical protein
MQHSLSLFLSLSAHTLFTGQREGERKREEERELVRKRDRERRRILLLN